MEVENVKSRKANTALWIVTWNAAEDKIDFVTHQVIRGCVGSETPTQLPCSLSPKLGTYVSFLMMATRDSLLSQILPWHWKWIDSLSQVRAGHDTICWDPLLCFQPVNTQFVHLSSKTQAECILCSHEAKKSQGLDVHKFHSYGDLQKIIWEIHRLCSFEGT